MEVRNVNNMIFCFFIIEKIKTYSNYIKYIDNAPIFWYIYYTFFKLYKIVTFVAKWEDDRHVFL